MITRKDLKYELRKALNQLEEIASDDGAIQALKIIAKLIMLSIKLLLNIRDNQTNMMAHWNIKKLTSEDENE